MMLRASVESQGDEVDVHAVTDGKAAHASGVAHAEALIGFAERAVAAMQGDEEGAAGLAEARDRVRREIGGEGLVDAAGVVGNFQRMVRIADGTGIPLDAPVKILTEDIRADLGINGFGSAANTRPVGAVGRLVGSVLRPVSTKLFKSMARRRQRASRS